MTLVLKKTKADIEIQLCLKERLNFYVIAGAGSGKTTSLVSALDHIRSTFGTCLRRDAQRVVCVTYTKRAVGVISSRLGWDDLFVVSTLHGFLWNEIKRYTPDIRRALIDGILPAHITKKRADDNGGNSQKAVGAREKVLELEHQRELLKEVPSFSYSDSQFSDYEKGELGHDDVIDVAAYMITTSEHLRRIIGQKYPYIFVDEAQDTQENIVEALNTICENPGLPLVGYFGDPMQQIYDKRAGDFKGPTGSVRIPKEENFRCSRAVVELLNTFRTDIQQVAAGKNSEVSGSVSIALIQTEAPAGPRNTYTSEQVDRASGRLDTVLLQWGWAGLADVKHLYLVRQMIARRLNFLSLHKLFTGDFASSRAKDDYESGEHFLLKQIIDCVYPLVQSVRTDNFRAAIDLLRDNSPAFDPKGFNSKQKLDVMLKRAEAVLTGLNQKWRSENIGNILRYCREHHLCVFPKRLSEQLDRHPRTESYSEELHAENKSDWLADAFFTMNTGEIERYTEFIKEKTEFSTQHGVKGEEYNRVLVVFDDVGSAWNNYNFAKTLTPTTAGAPTDRQLRLTTNLAYVCFSRAEVDLRIVLFSSNAIAARQELLDKRLFKANQIEITE